MDHSNEVIELLQFCLKLRQAHLDKRISVWTNNDVYCSFTTNHLKAAGVQFRFKLLRQLGFEIASTRMGGGNHYCLTDRQLGRIHDRIRERA